MIPDEHDDEHDDPRLDEDGDEAMAVEFVDTPENMPGDQSVDDQR